MQATRVIIATNEHGQIIGLPPLWPSVRVEAIFLVLDDPPALVPPASPPGLTTPVMTSPEMSNQARMGAESLPPAISSGAESSDFKALLASLTEGLTDDDLARGCAGDREEPSWDS